MVVSFASSLDCITPVSSTTHYRQASLLQGEIFLETRSHTAWGAGVTAQMYLPQNRDVVWQHITNYPQWTQYFLDVKQSRILGSEKTLPSGAIEKRLYQSASKTILFISASAEIYLRVVETANQHIHFYFESGNFIDFEADLRLQEYAAGTVLIYSVQATPVIPIPSFVIQQAIHFDLRSNLQQMRQVICRK